MSVKELKHELAQLSPSEQADVAAFLAELRQASPGAAPGSFLQTARGLKLDGPTDWSERFEEYLYGTG